MRVLNFLVGVNGLGAAELWDVFFVSNFSIKFFFRTVTYEYLREEISVVLEI